MFESNSQSLRPNLVTSHYINISELNFLIGKIKISIVASW